MKITEFKVEAQHYSLDQIISVHKFSSDAYAIAQPAKDSAQDKIPRLVINEIVGVLCLKAWIL